MVDVLLGVLGWAAGKLGDHVITALTPSELSSRLTAAIENWAQALPEDRSVEPSAIFETDEPEPGPALRLIYEDLIDSRAPNEDEWHEALLEQWRGIRAKGGDLQNLFRVPEEDASRELRVLASRLATVCRSDEKMFRVSTFGLHERIVKWLDLEKTAARKHNETVIMLVNDIVFPDRWDHTYKLSFHALNGTDELTLLDHLHIEVRQFLAIERFGVKTPGAPIQEYQFTAHLLPKLEKFTLTAAGPRLFTLDPGAAEFFHVGISGEPGWDYLISIAASVTRLQDGHRVDVVTPDLWLSFEAL